MKAILIDDEPLALQYLERQLEKNGKLEVVDTFTRFEVQKKIELLNNINITFLDIEMPEMNGLEMAEKILEINPNIVIIFITAYNNYAIQAFELNALDYLLKPVRTERLDKTVDRIISQINKKEKLNIIEKENIHIKVSGELSFYIDDDLIIVDWRTSRAKEVFLYLLLNKKQIVRKSDLIELFWGEYDVDRAYSLLYTTIYHVRKALKQFKSNLTIINKQEGYILMTNNIKVDLIEWEATINKMLPINDKNIAKFEDVMKLYTDGYLQNNDYFWSEPERYRLENKWISIAFKIGELHFKNKNYQTAESWFIKICQVRPEEERAHFFLMKLYANLNYGMLVNYQYEKLNNILIDLELPVSNQIKTWYNDWNKCL